MNGILDELERLEAKMRELMRHSEATQQDKASIVLAGLALGEIRNRRERRSAAAKNDAFVPGLDPGWMVRRERAEEVADA